MFKVSKTNIKNLLIIEGKQYSDNRGYLRELLSEKEIGCKFKFAIVSKSKKNILRGLHFQNNKPQGKYISVLKGKILDVAVDLRRKSVTFGKTFSIILSEKNCKGVFIPAGFAHGFQTLQKDTEIIYFVTEKFSIEHDNGINPFDPAININWPLPCSLLSEKDKNRKFIKDINFKGI